MVVSTGYPFCLRKFTLLFLTHYFLKIRISDGAHSNINANKFSLLKCKFKELHQNISFQTLNFLKSMFQFHLNKK